MCRGRFMSTALEIRPESRVVLHGVTWELYEKLLELLDEQHVYLTYDGGELELMSPQPKHEHYKWTISRWIVVMAIELSLNVRPGGSITFRRKDLKKGLEPDDCFWIANEPAIRDKSYVDLETDPPPDLALEIDITSSSVNRQAIYAALGIRELWRYNGKELRAFQLQPDGTYVQHDKSLSFPFLPLKDFQQFFERPKGIAEGEWITSFQKWVCEKVKR
jgi:Uma2 family endonuclease